MASFAIPLSGLEASSDALNVISNNLANLNTDGFKSQNLTFGDIFAQMQGTSGNGDPIQVGGGVEVNGTVSNFTNGNVASTGIASNMALQGNGFFIVSNNGQTNYTRNGDFSLNSKGQMVDANGDLVMGYPANAAGQVQPGGALAPITVNAAATLPAQATTNFSITTNLQADSPVGTTFSTPLAIVDSLGETQNLTITYTNTATNTWTYNITLPGAATGAAAPTSLANGTLVFNTSGELITPAESATGTNTITGINIAGLVDGAANMSMTWNLNSAVGAPAITQQDNPSATTRTSVDGYGAGTLIGYNVLSNGTVEGTFSNNQTLALGQIAVATFANNQGLSQTNGGDLQATTASGAAVIGQAGAGGNGTITGGAVEESNVDLSTEFSNMIVVQQSYEANAKSLTTLDQVAQATIQMIT